MTNRTQVITAIEESKIIVILRGFTSEQFLKTAEALEAGGVRLVELPFDQSHEENNEQIAQNIAALKAHFGDRMHIGAGTVLTEAQVDLAHRAGADFILAPDCCEAVVRKTRALGMVSIPGAFTPTEAANAHRYGADFVKLFPNSETNPSYLKALRVPLSHIKFLVFGGVTQENLATYLAAGAVGAGIATAIADKKAIESGDYAEITRRALDFTQQISKQ